MIPIPLYDENRRIIRTVKFVDNLTIDTPPYQVLERGCGVGLKRLKKGKYQGMLVLMKYDYWNPTGSEAEFISEDEAYELCLNRGRAKLIEELGLMPMYPEKEVEVS